MTSPRLKPLTIAIPADAEPVVESFAIDLKTSFTDSNQKQINITAKAEQKRKLSKASQCIGQEYVVYLHAGSKEAIGHLQLNLINVPDDINSDKKIPYIQSLDLDAYNRNIDTTRIWEAVHECLFRMSLLLGCEGRIHIVAARGNDYFLYNKGYRRLNQSEYYLTLAGYVVKQQQLPDLGVAPLYLPRKTIEANIKKWEIDFQLPAENESEDILEYHKQNDAIIEEAKKNSLAIQVLLAIHSGYANRDDQPRRASLFKKSEALIKFEKENPSLFCEVTKKFLELAKNIIRKEIALNTADKEKNIAMLVAGTMILIMMYQDKQYGTQARYNNQLLYPDAKFDDLPRKGKPIEVLLLELGSKALVDHAIPFYLNEKLFPQLSAIASLRELFDSVKHRSRLG